MKVNLKPIEDQVIVITGASSGIGLSAAKLAASQGARVVLSGRDEKSLREAVDEITLQGGKATYAVAEVSNQSDLRKVAEIAVQEFGGIDTWVNNAGVSIFGMSQKISLEDARKLFDTNYWGVVHGSLIAAEYLRGRGGVIINMGSVTSDRAIPLQGHYSASKHAVKGFTDAFRVELNKEEAPIIVTLIKPASIATPYPQHAKNYMDEAATLPPPVYAPEVVARTIIECAQKPIREIAVGGGSFMLSKMGRWFPELTDRYMENVLFSQSKKGRQVRKDRKSILHRAIPGSGKERGELDRRVMESSLYTESVLHPLRTTFFGLALAGVGATATMLWRRLS